MNRMNFEEFKNYIKDHIGEYLSSEYDGAEMKIVPIKKSSGYNYDSLNISNPNDGNPSIIPALDLTRAYENYQDGDTPEKIMVELARLRMTVPIPEGVTKDMFLDFNNVREKIYPRLINPEAQSDYMANKPSKQVADLAMIYAIRIQADSNGVAEAVIDNDLLDLWKVDVDELDHAAMDNMNSQDPIFMNLEEAMFGALSHQEEPEFDIENIDAEDYSIPFFLLTNRQKVKGAAMAANPKVMNKITERLGELYVIPSSVDEVLVVPKDLAGDPDELSKMVKAVNEDAVRPEDRLSDNVYEYDLESQTLKVASNGPVQDDIVSMKM